MNIIYHDIFSNWFTMRVLIINSFKNIDITHHFAIFYDLTPQSDNKVEDRNAGGPSFKFYRVQYFFPKRGSCRGSRCLGLAVASAVVDYLHPYNFWSLFNWIVFMPNGPKNVNRLTLRHAELTHSIMFSYFVCFYCIWFVLHSFDGYFLNSARL